MKQMIDGFSILWFLMLAGLVPLLLRVTQINTRPSLAAGKAIHEAHWDLRRSPSRQRFTSPGRKISGRDKEM